MDTVLSLHEDPDLETPPDREDPARWQADELRNMRENTVSVLMQLSDLGHTKYRHNILAFKEVRQSLRRDQPGNGQGLRRTPSAVESDNYVSLEGSSNLFYYLFEDYFAAVPILKGSRKMLSDLVSTRTPP